LKLTSDSLATQLGERLLLVYLISGDEPLLAAEAADAVSGSRASSSVNRVALPRLVHRVPEAIQG
jgi:hypothetical protein